MTKLFLLMHQTWEWELSPSCGSNIWPPSYVHPHRLQHMAVGRPFQKDSYHLYFSMRLFSDLMRAHVAMQDVTCPPDSLLQHQRRHVEHTGIKTRLLTPETDSLLKWKSMSQYNSPFGQERWLCDSPAATRGEPGWSSWRRLLQHRWLSASWRLKHRRAPSYITVLTAHS